MFDDGLLQPSGVAFCPIASCHKGTWQVCKLTSSLSDTESAFCCVVQPIESAAGILGPDADIEAQFDAAGRSSSGHLFPVACCIKPYVAYAFVKLFIAIHCVICKFTRVGYST